MKSHVFSVLVIVAFALVASACAAGEEKLTLTVLSSMDRIGQAETPNGPRKAEIKAAGNEVESFQVVVTAPQENVKVVAAEISDLIAKDGFRISKENITLFRAEYVRVRRSTPRAQLPPGLYSDPLVPFVNPITDKPIQPRGQISKIDRWGEPTTTVGYEMYAVPFDLFKGRNQPLWVDVYVPKSAPAGVYEGTFQVTAAGGISAQIPVVLTVWGFTLPDGPTHRNHFGGFGRVAEEFSVKRGSKEFEAIEMQYCRAMAQNRINPPIPRRLLPEVADDGSLKIIPDRHEALKKFISELNVTDFEIPRAPFSYLPSSTLKPDYKHISPANAEKAQRYYRQFYQYLTDNGWEKRAYVYMLDEPNLRENYEQVIVLGRLVHEAVPRLKCLVVEQTYPQDPSWPSIDEAVDIWCPLWSFIDERSIKERIGQGDEVWSYTALVQRAPRYHPQYEKVKALDPPYWHLDRPLCVYRVPTWINYRYNITGLLYWTTVTKVVEPWHNPAFSHSGNHYNAGGFLFYPGVPCGIDGPIPSMRLKNLRDGMEDYEYFVILEELAGREPADKLVRAVAPNWWDFSNDAGAFLAAREKIAEHISRLTKLQK
jgi:hypothetical protein